MKSQTSQVACSCRIREWVAMVQECRNRPNGMSVDEWCQANNITKANYYYRFAQVRKACLDSIPSDTVEHAIIPAPMELMHTEPESTAVDSNSPLIQDSFLDISANGVTICVTEQTSSSLLKKVLEVLRTFLEDGEVPMDNNAAEQSIRPFCVGKKNWIMIDTVAGAEASAMIYSIAETAKANKLMSYNYFKYLLEEIPRHMDDHGVDFCEDLLLWSDKLPAECRKHL